jgi:phage terminase large subunit-like protein
VSVRDRLANCTPQHAEEARRLVEQLQKMSPESRTTLLARLKANLARMDAGRRFELMYPDRGPLRRELYKKHIDFFNASATHSELALVAANRVGKTTAASYAMCAHLTGRYPSFWKGRRFDRPITGWCAGVDAKSARESVQAALFGEPGRQGQGMLPAEVIESTTARAGVSGAIDTAIIRHVSGGRSRLVIKSYDAGRESFQGAKIDVGWCDEEPPAAVFSEFLTRLLSTAPDEPSGLMMLTFTPLLGLSDVVLSFMPGGKPPKEGVMGSDSASSKWVSFISMDEAPHIPAAEREKLAASFMPHEKEARTKGIPSLGAGAIYPVPESDIVVKPFEIPAWYRHAFGLDVGWNRTAVVWGALDPETDILTYTAHITAARPNRRSTLKRSGLGAPGSMA